LQRRKLWNQFPACGLGIRALASAIEKEGMEVLGVTSYGDLSQFEIGRAHV